jgi:agmatine deiminase
MEGGAIHTDGQGTLLVTEQCLLNRNRNPQLSKQQIEQYLRDYTGAEAIIWLGQGVVNDETDGHVDNLACFARPGEVCLTYAENRRDPQWAVSNDALERLHAARDARGRRLTVHKLPSPGPLKMRAAEAAGVQHRAGTQPREAGLRLAASYANFYIANGGIVVPLLDARTDAAALAKLRRVFPERKVVGVPGREILLGGGNIHCITQQVPAVKRRSPSRS